MRQIVLDTETTGLDPAQGHRIIEIGCVELINRRQTDNTYHQYVKPDREIDSGAIDVHGITNEFLADKPRFEDVAADFVEYIKGAEIIIHNAPFDTGFIDHELRLMEKKTGSKEKSTLASLCTITDTLKLARDMHPGQKNSLDALCKRYEVDNSARTVHGALLDAEILAEVFLAMTGGQSGLFDDGTGGMSSGIQQEEVRLMSRKPSPALVLGASAEELAQHEAWIKGLKTDNDEPALWTQLGLD